MKRTISVIQKISSLFIIVGGINVFFPINFWQFNSEVVADIAAAAMVVFALIVFYKKRDRYFNKKALGFFILLLPVSLSFSYAQQSDYQKQIDAFKESFTQKNITPVKPYISSELSFFTYPAGATPQILAQVFSNLPPLNSIKITGSKPGEASIHYNFTGLGDRNSKILFDEAGKMTRIELIDNLLEEQAKAQEALAKQVQQPTPGELGKKYPPKKVRFSSKDGLMISGNLYETDPANPVILLCHSGGGNKFEYADIAPKLNAKGFNVLAIDQRSGGTFAGQANETFEQAKTKGLNTEFTDAQQDIEAAVNYLAGTYDKKITLWGSSYSAALSLFIAQKNEHLNGLILFSPGDYLAGQKGSLKGKLASLELPFLMTSTQEEAEAIKNILLHDVTLSENQFHHIPSFEGYHGVRALWEGQQGAEEYWEAVNSFLSVLYQM